jgi:hypothetical protein
MRNARRWLAGCLLSALVALLAFDPGASAQDVVFAAIGSRHYARSEAPTIKSLSDIPGADRSAARVADILLSGGARGGVLLQSSAEAPLTRGDMVGAIDEAIALATAQPKPFLIVYLAAHGLSEGFGWTHLSIPGALLFDASGGKDQAAFNLEAVSSRALAASEIVERLNKTSIPYLLLLDSCYEGDAADLTALTRVLSATAQENVADVAAILRAFNQFRQASPVVFSATPGSLVSTAADPRSSQRSLAPLARRLTLLADRSAKPVNLGELVDFLTDAAADAVTQPGITFAQDLAKTAQILLTPTAPGAARVLKPAGAAAEICCAPIQAEPSAPAHTYFARLELAGPAGEFVSAGRKRLIQADGVSLDAASPGALEVLLWPPGGEAWSITIKTADGQKFVAGQTYKNARRFEDGAPTIDVSGDGRACNETDGSFTVRESRYDQAGALMQIAVEFTQRCDGGPGALTGRLVLDRRS